MIITRLPELFEAVKTRTKKRLVAAYAVDDHSIMAISKAIDMGIVDATLVGDEELIKKVCDDNKLDPRKFNVIHEPNDILATAKAVELINKGEGDVLMKGLISTDKYMRAILNKEKGLLPPKGVLSHVTVLDMPSYHKVLVVGDVAVIPAPDLKQKIAITNYLISVANSIGIKTPKVALVAATEQMLSGMPACVDAALISKMGDRGQMKKAIIDGPLSLDVAINEEAAILKGVISKVAGDADCLLFPNIESGNVFFKSVTKLAGGELAAVVMGTKAPCVLTSRGDTELSKMYSIALAALSVKQN